MDAYLGTSFAAEKTSTTRWLLRARHGPIADTSLTRPCHAFSAARNKRVSDCGATQTQPPHGSGGITIKEIGASRQQRLSYRAGHRYAQGLEAYEPSRPRLRIPSGRHRHLRRKPRLAAPLLRGA